MKQFGLALHSYHDQTQVFPPGGLAPMKCSFFTMLLPYIDQTPAYKSMDFTSGFTNNGGATITAAMQVVLTNLKVPALNCPSSELKTSVASVETFAIQRPNYVGISGAVISPVDGTTNIGGAGGTYGWYLNNGVLAANSQIRIRDIIDGTSNVMAMSEQGRPRTDDSDNRSCMHGGGAWKGCYLLGEGNSGNFCQNLTSIAYSINNMATGLVNADTPYKSSNPLSSRHAGGVHALRGDGSVVFLNQSINFTTLLRLASIKDKQVVGEY